MYYSHDFDPEDPKMGTLMSKREIRELKFTYFSYGIITCALTVLTTVWAYTEYVHWTLKY